MADSYQNTTATKATRKPSDM